MYEWRSNVNTTAKRNKVLTAKSLFQHFAQGKREHNQQLLTVSCTGSGAWKSHSPHCTRLPADSESNNVCP